MQRVERVALRMCKIQESRNNKSCSTIRTQAREFPTYININILERLTKDELRQYKLLHVSMQALFSLRGVISVILHREGLGLRQWGGDVEPEKERRNGQPRLFRNVQELFLGDGEHSRSSWTSIPHPKTDPEHLGVLIWAISLLCFPGSEMWTSSDLQKLRADSGTPQWHGETFRICPVSSQVPRWPSTKAATSLRICS